MVVLLLPRLFFCCVSFTSLRTAPTPLRFLPPNQIILFSSSSFANGDGHSAIYRRKTASQSSSNSSSNCEIGQETSANFGNSNTETTGAELNSSSSSNNWSGNTETRKVCNSSSGGGSSRSNSSSNCEIGQETSAKFGNSNTDHDDQDYWDKMVLFEDVKLLTKFQTPYNFIRVLEVARQADHPTAGSRVLLLDRPGNVQSIYNPYRILTGSYYDVFATLPPLLPHGPLAVLGLGAGTTARLLLHFWRGREIHGWEIDSEVINVARQYFDLLELEEGTLFLSDDNLFFGSIEAEDDATIKQSRPANASYNGKNKSGYEDKLYVHIGDALQSDPLWSRRFAGIFVDLFAGGAVVSPLQKAEAWQFLKEKLIEGGRIMVNCGGSCVEAEGPEQKDGHITMEETLHAMAKVFHGQLLKIEVGKRRDSIVALTGPMPDLWRWKEALPHELKRGTLNWVAPL